MAEIINLNRARKTKNRAEKRKIADQNAQKFGRTKGEKKRDDLIAAKAKDYVDQHKLDT
jgi:rRNA-processing protein FCF1